MSKKYFLTAGSKTRTIESYVQELSEKLDFDFEQHESSFVGNYFLYQGLYADRFTIQPNQVGETYNFEWAKEYPTIIQASITEGRETDKKSTFLHLKKILSRLESTDILKETILE